MNSPAGTWTLGASSQAPATLYSGLYIVDVNNDGKPDILGQQSSASTIQVLLGNGDGTFHALPPGPAVENGSYNGIEAVADINADGILDIVLSSFNSAGTGPTPLMASLGKGDGTFGPEMDVHFNNPVQTDPYGYPMYPEPFLIADFDGDGLPDLFEFFGDNYDTSNTGQTYFNTPVATATASTSYTPPAGSHAIQASYAGNNTFAPSTSPTVTVTGSQTTADKTSTVVTVQASSLANGASETLTATVRDTTTPATNPAGSVTFFDTFNGSTATIGSSPVSNGVATVAYTSTSAGRHIITATFTPSDASLFTTSGDTAGKNVTVLPITTTINFSVPSQVYKQSLSVSLSATSNSPATITYTLLSGNGEAEGQNGNVLFIGGVGTFTVQASQPASGNYAAASKTATFTVIKGKQTLTYPGYPGTLSLSQSPLTLYASVDTGLPITFTVLQGPGTIQNGNQLVANGPGSITVAAQQLGNDNYNPSARIARVYTFQAGQ